MTDPYGIDDIDFKFQEYVLEISKIWIILKILSFDSLTQNNTHKYRFIFKNKSITISTK